MLSVVKAKFVSHDHKLSGVLDRDKILEFRRNCSVGYSGVYCFLLLVLTKLSICECLFLLVGDRVLTTTIIAILEAIYLYVCAGSIRYKLLIFDFINLVAVYSLAAILVSYNSEYVRRYIWNVTSSLAILCAYAYLHMTRPSTGFENFGGRSKIYSICLFPHQINDYIMCLTLRTNIEYGYLDTLKNSCTVSRILEHIKAKTFHGIYNERLNKTNMLQHEDEAGIQQEIAEFMNKSYGQNFDFRRLHAMDELYATRETFSGLYRTVGTIHTDGNIPNFTGLRCYRMLVCVKSLDTESETVFECENGSSKTKLCSTGQYVIFDYNCQPHYVKQALNPRFRCFLKIHFAVFPKHLPDFVSKSYFKMLEYDNKSTRRVLDARREWWISNKLFEYTSYIKAIMFDLSPDQNFVLNQSTSTTLTTDTSAEKL